MVRVVEGQIYLRRDEEPTGKLVVIRRNNIRRLTRHLGICREDYPALEGMLFDPLNEFFYNPAWKGFVKPQTPGCDCGHPDCPSGETDADLIQMAH